MQRGTGSGAASFYRIKGNNPNAARLSRPERGQLELHPKLAGPEEDCRIGSCGAEAQPERSFKSPVIFLLFACYLPVIRAWYNSYGALWINAYRL